MDKKPEEYLALALDNVPDEAGLASLINATAKHIGVYKIGLEQFTHFGPSILNCIREAGRRIFLDLKFHDIPNTVYQAVKSASLLNVDYLTVHCLGGLEMLTAAKKAALEMTIQGYHPPKIIGVTLLTSISTPMLREELAVPMDSSHYARHLAALAVRAGIDGIVCSAVDLPVVKPLLPSGFEIITPGIRPQGSIAHDQKRVATPRQAIDSGATLLVVGRAITEAPDPGRAAETIHKELTGQS